MPKPQPVYARNSGKVDSSKIIDNGSALVSNRYRYVIVELSLNKFDHTTGKFLKITTSLTERSDKSGWGSGTGYITEVTVVPKTYDLLREYGKFMVEEFTAHIKVYVDANSQCTEQNSEMLVTCILVSVSSGTIADIHSIPPFLNSS